MPGAQNFPYHLNDNWQESVSVHVYALQANLSEADRELLPGSQGPGLTEQLIICGDWSGHIGAEFSGYEEAQGGNTEGKRVLAFEVPKARTLVKSA